MSFNVKSMPYFDKQAKHLAKKYASFKGELKTLIDSLVENPKQGEPLGNGCYKIRLAIESKGKGKRGGARIVTHIHIIADTVYLLTVYSKSEKENISDKEINELLKDIPA